jgi:hypothetical protein
MSAQTIEETWMEPPRFIGSKIREARTLGRRVLGEKGIGRFATSRLAEELEVITRRPRRRVRDTCLLQLERVR